MPRRQWAAYAAVLLAVSLAACSSTSDAAGEPSRTVESSAPAPGPEPQSAPESASPEPAQYTRIPGIVTNADVSSTDDPLGRWRREVPVEEVRIPSTVDGYSQPALWSPPSQAGRPLLVLVHSWSTGYEQELNLPYAEWAEQVGWGYVQPDFRGVNDDPQATGSDLAVQDVVDAVDFAVAQGGVDPERVYVLGFSGGGMMSLLLAGRHADRFAGAVSWVPIYDLTAWYVYSRDEQPDRAYAEQIRASCGGDPTSDAAAQASCTARSPAAVLGAAREAQVPVYIGAGIADDVVPPSDALRAFNDLAAEVDRVPEAALQSVAAGVVPPGLTGTPDALTGFTTEDPAVVLALSSGPVTAVLFEGEHAMVYYPGLEWLAQLDAAS